MGTSKTPVEMPEMTIDDLGTVAVGEWLVHPTFGRGVVEGLYLYKDGTKIVRLKFAKHGSKGFAPEFVRFERVT